MSDYDPNEDPEERRRRIEAERAASNLAAGIDLIAMGIEALKDREDNLPDDLQDEQDEMTISM